MGAESFINYGFGKNMADAFKAKAQECRHAYGHDGYTGSIAEKSSVHEVTLAPRVKFDARKIHNALIGCWLNGETDRKALAYLCKVFDTTEAGAIRIAQMHDDKWGPAIGIKVPAHLARELKRDYGLLGKRVDVFVFMGFASS